MAKDKTKANLIADALLGNLTKANTDPAGAQQARVQDTEALVAAGGTVAMPVTPPPLNKDGTLKGEGNANDKPAKPDQG